MIIVTDSEIQCLLMLVTIFAIFVLFILIIRLLIMFCCTKAQRKKAARKLGNSLRKNTGGGMFARLEEFDVLTPLQPTPVDSIASNGFKAYGSASTSSSSNSQKMLRISSSSDSPPPPRRPTHGKTLIVPLSAPRYRIPSNIVGTPDSRYTSFEGGTTKSCATIPEDDEEEIDELLSIDRTSVSAADQQSRNHYSCTLSFPQQIPEFQLPAPAYSPPSLPSESPAKRPTTLSPEQDVADQSSIYEAADSPQSSATLSDSLYLNNYDIVSSAANSQIFESSLCGESDIVLKFQLHRIEEESEGVDDLSATGSGGQIPDEGVQCIPRSISQQFDMLRRQ